MRAKHRRAGLALAPLLAIAAFAIAPAAAQAAPHWYKCEHFAAATHNRVDSQCSEATTTGHWELKRLPFTSAKTKVVTSGKLTLTWSNGVVIECKVLDAGNVWNTVLAEVGKGNVEVFVFYECTSAQCATVSIVWEKLPYETQLEEAVAGTPRVVIKGMQITLNCAGTLLTFTGELKPKIINATASNMPTWAEFDATAGTLNGPGGLTSTWTGKDRIAGFEAWEGIQVKNP
jgi:hypothetical protein